MADQPDKPAEPEKAAPKTVVLAVAFPVESHYDPDSGLTISAEGTEVPASKAKAVIAAAAPGLIYEVKAV